MPRKTRRDLVDTDEEQAQIAREEACRQLAADLHRSWRTMMQLGETSYTFACQTSCGGSPAVAAYP